MNQTELYNLMTQTILGFMCGILCVVWYIKDGWLGAIRGLSLWGIIYILLTIILIKSNRRYKK
jgi:hypothetical protein